MTLPLSATDATTRPLFIVAPEGLEAWLSRQPAPVGAWLRGTGFAAAPGDLRLLPGPDGAPVAAVIGQGTPAQRARTRFAVAAAARLPEGDWHLDGDLTDAERDEAVLAFLLGAYRFDRYRAQPGTGARLKLPAGSHRLAALAEGEWLTRDLINTPAADMGPAELEAATAALAERHGATLAVTKGEDLRTGFPMIHAVGHGSDRAPRLLDLRWGSDGPALTLVGKGVCFDTGGLDIKPSASMLLMKKDMGGAATVLGLAHAIMALNLPIRLRVLIPAVENAVSGRAFRPKDILSSRKGLTVEVNNTDAEGRLVLADALAYAAEEGADLTISMATLTGAARVAVGPDLAPYFTDDGTVAAALDKAAAQVRDPVWRLPFWEPYEAMIEPGIADLDNAPAGGMAGAITAALFLRRFAGDRYVHFDIYGHQPADAPGRPKGGVGQGARAILQALPDLLGF
ncbi:leucyl aminopeptidase family protein [Falsirhodobacter sp. 20TX0035]|uniref:leucyl aminopeptidase family protein n=1 Tax=Falsirhodobacter sp. 20TX0035 TaxID=3022019 RepID=UPI00232E3C23|nr:leucyl aminopeptidase family protein [Falsirhodobacter sp. 20TX0035]MDB6453980.1 leucyl aminopeptidase family protein [Falsirhodobacter sp. 20TX0035]